MAIVGSAGRTRRDVSRQKNEADVSAAVTALQHKGDQKSGAGTAFARRPGTGLKKRS